MASPAEFSFSDLVREPTRVASAVEERGRVLLHRRNAPDLVLSRATELSELGAFARLLSGLVKRVTPSELSDAVVGALPWTRYLDKGERTEFVTDLLSVVRDCEDLETLAPLEIYLAQWRSTAAILADPELADRLSRPVPQLLGRPVAPP